jgi:hypothetical protein
MDTTNAPRNSCRDYPVELKSTILRNRLGERVEFTAIMKRKYKGDGTTRWVRTPCTKTYGVFCGQRTVFDFEIFYDQLDGYIIGSGQTKPHVVYLIANDIRGFHRVLPEDCNFIGFMGG